MLNLIKSDKFTCIAKMDVGFEEKTTSFCTTNLVQTFQTS